MTKDEYLSELRVGLAAFSKDEVDRAVSFYEEMVDDRVEAGVSEEEAVGSLEPPAEAAARIISEMPAVPRAAARLRSPKTPRSWFVAFVVAAVIGSPVWIPLTLGVIIAVIGCFIGLFGLLGLYGLLPRRCYSGLPSASCTLWRASRRGASPAR